MHFWGFGILGLCSRSGRLQEKVFQKTPFSDPTFCPFQKFLLFRHVPEDPNSTWEIQQMQEKDQSNLSGDTFSIEAPQSLLRTEKNILRTFPLVRNFPLKVAANFLEHSFGAFIEKVSPFMPT